MTTQNRQWLNLDECINDYLDESEQGNYKYFKCFHLAFRAMTELGLDVFYAVKSVKLPVNANLTVTLPADYLNYSKVGVFNQQGEVITMGVNNNLSTAYDLQPTRLSQTQDNTIPTAYNQDGIGWYNYYNGYGVGVLYGLPSGTPFIGSYKIDNANGVMVLSENFPYDYVVLEYISSPKEGGDYYVPVQFKEAIIAYLAWKDIRSMPVKTHMQNNSTEARRRDFYNERRLAIARYDPIRLPDLYQWLLETQRLAVKS